jgi:predicted transposase YdaD
MKTELFDRTLKQLVDFDPQNWASLTGLPSVVSGVPLSPELAATHQRVDALLSITMPDGQCAVHLEFQAGKDGRQVPKRLLEYSVGITTKHHLQVHTCVFLLTPSADSPALDGKYIRQISGQSPYMTFTYAVIRFWRVPLAVLMAITQCITVIPDEQTRLEILGHAYTLAGMRFNPKKADTIFERQLTMLEQSSTVQHLLRRGRNEGLALGILAGARKHFIETATLFFGPVPEDCAMRVNTAQEADISRWTSRLRNASSWEQLLGDGTESIITTEH